MREKKNAFEFAPTHTLINVETIEFDWTSVKWMFLMLNTKLQCVIALDDNVHNNYE